MGYNVYIKKLHKFMTSKLTTSKILKNAIQSKKFHYEKDGIVLTFSLNFDSKNTKELDIFYQLLQEACKDLVTEIEQL